MRSDGEQTGPGEAPVNRDIPRRRRIPVGKRRDEFLNERAPRLTRPTPGSIARRMARWSAALLRLAAVNVYDRLRFRRSPRQGAIRLREMLQSLGGTGIKIGQQLGLRADIIPIEYCDELMKLLDQVPPFPSDVAMAIIERETGKPLAETFESFDPQVIGSGSIGCVYQAHLRNGAKVAVKVRRPGIEMDMRSDLKVLEWLGGTAEALSIIPVGSARPTIREITRMLVDEVDYHLEAQQTETFGIQAAKANVVRVPEVIHELCGPEVIVTEFVDGVFLHEILNAMENEDPSYLEELKAEGYDPVAISKRLVRMMFWQMYDSDMFHADPHPANIVVRADNSITLIDFGVCGALSRQSRRALQAIFRNHTDPHEMARAIIATQQPLPYIDVDQYAHELYYLVRDQMLAMNSRSGKWYEKSAGALWSKAAEIGREYKVRLNPELLRYMRTSFLGDAILVRLNPNLNMAEEFKSYYEDYLANERAQAGESALKGWKDLLREGLRRLNDLSEVVGLELERRRQVLERPTYRYGLRVEKSAYGVSEFLGTILWSITWLFVWAGGRAIARQVATGIPGTLAENLHWTLTHPGYLALLVLSALVTFRKVTRRLDEPDPTDR